MDILLHHYELSPFSEKVRRVLGLKGLAWKAVDQPIIAPKPKLTPLTGGYRRIPVMQIGADVWCDTAIICRKLDELAPAPTLFPGGKKGAAEIMGHWADHWLFMAAVPPALEALLPALPPGFMDDRSALSGGMFSLENVKAVLPSARSRYVVGVDWLESQLEGRDFLLGKEPSLADFSTFHVLWFSRHAPECKAAIDERKALAAWFARIEALGTGKRADLAAEDALAIAREAEPATAPMTDGRDPQGIEPGDAIVVASDDYGADPVRGEAVVVTTGEIALRRRDDLVGEVIVHFPRDGYRVSRA